MKISVVILCTLSQPVVGSIYKLPVLISTSKARFSKRIMSLEESFSISNEIMARVPATLRSDVKLNIQDAAELGTGLMAELCIVSTHYDRFKSASSACRVIDIHRRLVKSIEGFENTLDIASVCGDDALAKKFNQLAKEAKQFRSNLWEVKKVIKTKPMTRLVSDCTIQLGVLFSKTDDVEGDLAVIRIGEVAQILCRPIREVLGIVEALVTSFQKLLLLQFQAELQHLNVNRRPRMQSKDAATLDKVAMEARCDFKLSFANSATFGRRLDILLISIAPFLSVIRTRIRASYNERPAVLNAVELFIKHIVLDKQKVYAGLILNGGDIPSEFPVIQTEVNAKREARLIRDFNMRYVSLWHAHAHLQRLQQMV